MKIRRSLGRITVAHIACALLIASSLSGCEVVRMRVDPALAGVTPLKVERASVITPYTPVRFGDWHTTEMTVGWAKTRISGFFVDHQTSEQPYHFVLATASGPIAGDCLATARFDRANHDIQIDQAQLHGEPKFQCQFSGAAEGTLTLITEMGTSAVLLSGDFLAGDLEFGADHWEVSTTSQIEQVSGPLGAGGPVGYEIRREDNVVASVEVINGGRVWMSPASSQLDQDRLAATITALLVYREIPPVERDE